MALLGLDLRHMGRRRSGTHAAHRMGRLRAGARRHGQPRGAHRWRDARLRRGAEGGAPVGPVDGRLARHAGTSGERGDQEDLGRDAVDAEAREAARGA
jgi:hypothetical protein